MRLLAHLRKLLLLLRLKHHLLPLPVAEEEEEALAEGMLEGVLEAEVKAGSLPRLSPRLDKHHLRPSPLRLLHVQHLSLLLPIWRPSNRDRMNFLR